MRVAIAYVAKLFPNQMQRKQKAGEKSDWKLTDLTHGKAGAFFLSFVAKSRDGGVLGAGEAALSLGHVIRLIIRHTGHTAVWSRR